MRASNCARNMGRIVGQLFWLALPFLSQPVQADQSAVRPAIIVNDRAITFYELEQRKLFLKLLRTPGDLDEQVRRALIEDRLRLDAAAALGIEATDDEVTGGMTEFAQRAQLSTDEFLKALAQGGVEAQTFRDFVTTGLLWRQVVRTKFTAATTVTEAAIDQALAQSAEPAKARVLLSELIIPAAPEKMGEAEAFAADLAGKIHGEAAFAAAARQYSASPTRERGGVIDWLEVNNLPPALGALLLAMSPGDVTTPIILPNAIALFQLRAIDASRISPAAGQVMVDYARYLIPGGHSPAALSEAAMVRSQVDACNDLNRFAKGKPEAQLERTSQTMDQVPRDVGLELARLDEGESSVGLESAGNLVFLMLCSRTTVAEPPVSREDARVRLINQRLEGLSEGYLAELLADAHIVTP